MSPTIRNVEDDAPRPEINVGDATSELLSQAAERPLLTYSRNGFTIVRLSCCSPKVTTALVDDLSDEMR